MGDIRNIWNKLPTVISCCFCCFLRAGTVIISVVSFIVGVLFAPNVNHTPGFWDLDGVLSSYDSSTEGAIQMIMGIVSIILSSVSVLLLIGTLCNVPLLIEIYQWGAAFYGCVVVLLYFILAIFCFFVHSNSIIAGAVLLVLILCNVLVSELLRTGVIYPEDSEDMLQEAMDLFALVKTDNHAFGTCKVFTFVNKVL